MQTATNQTPVAKKKDELILVVAKKDLFPKIVPEGLIPCKEELLQERIWNHRQFIWRSKAELDPTFKQIIPYLVFKFENKLFLMQRAAKASEQRLKSKLTLGIGGHINESDLATGNIMDWAIREFHEEVDYKGTFTSKFLGLINDESSPVGQVHVGCLFLLEGNSNQICVKTELQNGSLISFDECEKRYDSMEKWTQMTFDYLKKLA